jgi:enoyl-CoA hydratase/carnithine racemase
MTPEPDAPTRLEWTQDAGVVHVRLVRPARKNPLTFEVYAELRDRFRALAYQPDAKVVILSGAGDNFCSGGDVHDIIGPLVAMDMVGLMNFTRMTGDLVKAMRACPQPIIAAVDGVCAGAGAILAMASDLRIATPEAKTAFLFNRVGLAGCDMGACAILPRIIGQGRAAELLYFGRNMTAEEGERWGYFNRLVARDTLMAEAEAMAQRIASGPTFANGMTKNQLNQEWNMSIDQAIEAEAQAQAICMRTKDFERAYHAFVDKRQPVFEGN